MSVKWKVPRCVEKVGGRTYFSSVPRIVGGRHGTTLSIGPYCSIGRGVTFFLGGHHDTTTVRIRRKGHSKGNIRILADCWIGDGAAVLDGVTVGPGAVVGARAVVTRDVPPYAVAAGNPARVVGYRFPHDVREALLASRWWDWPWSKVRRWWALIDGPPGPFLERLKAEESRDAKAR